MPEFKTASVGTLLRLVGLLLIGIRLELSVIELIAVVKEELVGRLHTGLHTILHHGAGPRWAG